MRNSGTQVVKYVVTIGLAAVPRGMERAEQNPEQLSHRIARHLMSDCPHRFCSTVSSTGYPRKPLQGLAVPQFHDFRRIGEKNTENRSAHIPGKRAPARSPHKPCVCLDRSGRVRIRSRGRTRPESPRRAPCAVRGGGSTVGNGRRGQKEEKHRFFSPIPAEYRRIYYQAGISVAVTSARNGGQRRRKTASFGGFGGS